MILSKLRSKGLCFLQQCGCLFTIYRMITLELKKTKLEESEWFGMEKNDKDYKERKKEKET